MGLTVKGRFAPSPTGRMHLGNVFSALISWLSARSRRGRWLLRIEDLDPQRSRTEYAMQIEDDLRWLGLDWDEGGTADEGDAGPYRQSLRGELYAAALERLRATGLTYPCTCRRADIMATQAPHQSDGRVIYAGTCRPASMPCVSAEPPVPHSTRIYVPDSEICFEDGVFGPQAYNLAGQCGDFVLRRADGAWAYQLAVVVDDAAMGVTQVVRGSDLLSSAPRQIWLQERLSLPRPEYGHLPLLLAPDGRRLAKRDRDLELGRLREEFTAAEIVGKLACAAGLIDRPEAVSPRELIPLFSWEKLPQKDMVI